jgi:hypothetical protein
VHPFPSRFSERSQKAGYKRSPTEAEPARKASANLIVYPTIREAALKEKDHGGTPLSATLWGSLVDAINPSTVSGMTDVQADLSGVKLVVAATWTYPIAPLAV